MTNKWILLATSLLLVSNLLGCNRRVTDFTVISTKNTQIVANVHRADRVKGEDCIVPFFGYPNMKTAIDRAIESAGPNYDALVDGVVWWKDRFIIVCYEVEGTPIKNRKSALLDEEGAERELLVHSGFHR